MLQKMQQFQHAFQDETRYDTDTTINSIRDAYIARLLGFELLNLDKHGFDAKTSDGSKYLEIKQCGLSAQKLTAVWNDTNLEKAEAFKSQKLFVAVGIWFGASELKAILYGQDPLLGIFLEEQVIRQTEDSQRRTQNIALTKLIKWNFRVALPAGQDQSSVIQLLSSKHPSLQKTLNNPEKICHVSDIQI